MSRVPGVSSDTGCTGVVSWITRGVVEQQRGPRRDHGEALAVRTVRLEDAGLAALHAVPRDQDHGDEIDAVAVRAFRRRSTDPVGRVDAELMRLDEPASRRSGVFAGRVADPVEHASEAGDQRTPRRVFGDARRDRLEPALHAAVQRVVLDRLPVRPVRRAREGAAGLENEARVPALSIATAVLQVRVGGRSVHVSAKAAKAGMAAPVSVERPAASTIAYPSRDRSPTTVPAPDIGGPKVAGADRWSANGAAWFFDKSTRLPYVLPILAVNRMSPMRNGDYRLLFSADGHTSDGRMTIAQGFATGGDGSYLLNGQVAEAGRHLIGTFDISLAPGMSPNKKIEESFVVHMNGKEDDAGFTLIGAGPLGIIVEITCRIDQSGPRLTITGPSPATSGRWPRRGHARTGSWSAIR